MSVILSLFVFVIAIFFIGVSLITNTLRAIFGIGNRQAASSQNQRQSQTGPHAAASPPNENPADPKRQKKFAKDEGEYVDFEEIKTP